TIGFLNTASADAFAGRLRAFHRGLRDAGYVEGRDVTFAYRWADGHNDRGRELATDLVRQHVSVIVANYPVALDAKLASGTIPIPFQSAPDPVKVGLVASLNRPGANVTGVHLIGVALEAKRLDILHHLVAPDVSIGVLLNPGNPIVDLQVRELQDAARAIGR